MKRELICARYGYTTNTKIKLIAVVMDDTDIKDSDIKNVCNNIYVARGVVL